MTLGTIARLWGRVTPTGDPLATLVGTVDNGTTPATLIGTVSRGLVDSCEAPCIRTGFKVRLNGTWIPDADLVAYRYRELIDTPVTFLDFDVVGSAYSVLTTLDSWTLVPVELWNVNGPPGAERETLRFAGYVRPGAAQQKSGNAGPGCTVSIACSNAIGRYGEFELCHEIDPLSGMTRGAIMAELCADAGLTAVDFPDGAIYTKGIQAKNTKLLAFLVAFAEPEGWQLRETPRAFADGGPILGAWSPAPLRPPIAADDTWDLSRSQVEITPPQDAPSRYVVRGYGAVVTDELGQTTRVTVTEIEALYAPKITPQRQLSDGTIISTGATAPAATLRLVQRITDTLVSRGEKPLSQEVLEEGWYNPRAAYKHTVAASGDYAYNGVYIDETGEYVAHWIERFMEIARRRILYAYDVDGDAVGETAQDFRWFLRTEGIGVAGSGVITVDGAYVYGDENSYYQAVEEYGFAEEHVATRTFDSETGAEDEVIVKSYGYRAPRSLIDGPTAPYAGYYVRSDGKGQSELVANWRQYAELRNRNIVVDGTLAATLASESRLDTYRMLAGYGTYQWGDFDSNYQAETLLLAGVERVQYKALSSESYERIIVKPEQPPRREIVSGRVPQPRYKTSPWTYLKQEPIELVVDDPVLEELLGFRRETVQNDHIQDLDEAATVVARRRARALARKVKVSRHESHLELGSTVFLAHPDHGLAHRALLAEATVSRSRTRPAQTAEYVLEVEL